jgi:hypothetical protein
LQFSLGEIKHIKEEMDERKEINEGTRRATEGALSVFAHLLSPGWVVIGNLIFLNVVSKGNFLPFGN